MNPILLSYIIRIVFGATALGVGLWYVSSSIEGSSLSYTSMDTLLNAIGVTDGNIAGANGCFLCGYVNELFAVLGTAAEKFWAAILENLWTLMVVGFGIFLFIHTIKYFYKAMADAAAMDGKEQKFTFATWFDPVWRNGIRIMMVGAILGAFGMGGTSAVKTLSNIVVQPVMYVGTELSMAATGVISSAQCVPAGLDQSNPIAPISNAFMCVVGNVNTVMLSGVAGGFALKNYAWMVSDDSTLSSGFGHSIMWISGWLIVIMFSIIGFDLFFQVLSVVFKLVFIIIFFPIFIAASAFEKTWKMANGVVGGAIKMLVGAAIKIIVVSLKVIIMYAIFAFAGATMFPGAGIFPPLVHIENETAEAEAIQTVFAKCESVSVVDGTLDKDEFRRCFDSEKASILSQYPHAFDVFDNSASFLLLVIGLFFLYIYVLSPKIDKLLAAAPSVLPFRSTDETSKGGLDDFGGEMKNFGKLAWKKPQDWIQKLAKSK